MKQFFYFSQERLTRCKMDWFIYNLIRDVLTHYWYGVQCKKFGYVKIKKQKGIVASAFLRAHDIPNTNVLLPKWGGHCICGIHQPPRKSADHTCSNFKMAECDCPLIAQGIVCKHVMKVFKMLHQNIRDIGSIVREINILHGVTKGGVIPKHNSPKCGLRDDDTKYDDPRDE